ncbi:hypothetical protein F4561_003626 [Lipingzhangella halophila]|uniref:Uncharacterized protein n=1 Tax=Lipingzhangella halophila TaxID=1783352 RepID=A0A7W7W3I2_9ACTN|nr:hypothetical protein [Lipingzhangella halophila]MBB4932806.1 hypothetical protein [Lipingzhangella halophila]
MAEETSLACPQVAPYLVAVAAELADALDAVDLEECIPASWETDENRRGEKATHWCTPAQVRPAIARVSRCLRDFTEVLHVIDQVRLTPEVVERWVTTTGGVPEALSMWVESEVAEQRMHRAEDAGYNLALLALLENGNVVLTTDSHATAPFLVARTLLVDPQFGDRRVRPLAAALTRAMDCYQLVHPLRGYRAGQALAQAGYAPALTTPLSHPYYRNNPPPELPLAAPRRLPYGCSPSRTGCGHQHHLPPQRQALDNDV